MKNIVFDPKAFKQFNEWAIEDKKLYKKIVDLIISRVNSPPLGAYEKSKKELQYPAACGGVVYLTIYYAIPSLESVNPNP